MYFVGAVVSPKLICFDCDSTLSAIEGIDELRSNSNQGNANTNITFNLEKDMDVAVQDVRDKIGPMVNRFGRDATPPVIQKADPDSGSVLTIAIGLARKSWSPALVISIAVLNLLNRSQSEGISCFSICGNR